MSDAVYVVLTSRRLPPALREWSLDTPKIPWRQAQQVAACCQEVDPDVLVEVRKDGTADAHPQMTYIVIGSQSGDKSWGWSQMAGGLSWGKAQRVASHLRELHPGYEIKIDEEDLAE